MKRWDYYLYEDVCRRGYSSVEHLGTNKAIAKSKALNRFTSLSTTDQAVRDEVLVCRVPLDQPFDINNAEVIFTIKERDTL